jgi:threonine aldolase
VIEEAEREKKEKGGKKKSLYMAAAIALTHVCNLELNVAVLIEGHANLLSAQLTQTLRPTTVFIHTRLRKKYRCGKEK